MKTKFSIGDVIQAKSGRIGEVRAIVATKDETRYYFSISGVSEDMAQCEAERDVIATFKANKVRKPRIVKVTEPEVSSDAR